MTDKLIKVTQTSKKISDNRWEWEIHLDGDAKNLGEIEYVEYILHDTFQDPIRRIYSPETGFKLETSGWGTFPVYFTIKLKDDTEINNKLILNFEKEIDKNIKL